MDRSQISKFTISQKILSSRHSNGNFGGRLKQKRPRAAAYILASMTQTQDLLNAHYSKLSSSGSGLRPVPSTASSIPMFIRWVYSVSSKYLDSGSLLPSSPCPWRYLPNPSLLSSPPRQQSGGHYDVRILNRFL